MTMTPGVLKALAPQAIWHEYRRVKPLPIEQMPDGATLRRIRQSAGLSRELLAVVSGTTVESIADVELGKTAFSLALNKSETGRRVVAALIALDVAKAAADEATA